MTNSERAKKIKMILMDVDGTLTDGTILVFSSGEELKAYHVRDGMGILMAHLVGLKTGVITGKTSPALEKRAAKLQLDEIHQGIMDKKSILADICQRHHLQPTEIAYIGDDLGDLEVLKRVGLAGAVADAHPQVKNVCHFIATKPGGRGAVREFIDFILTAQDKWEEIEEKLTELTQIK